MYQDLLKDIELIHKLGQGSDIFRLFVTLTEDRSRIIGARVVEIQDDMQVNHLGHPPVYGKRFAVHPQHRGRGIGRQLLTAGKQYCFETLGLKVMFGQSNELGALAMYGREGALFLRPSIEKCLRRNSPEQNVRFFVEFINNPFFRELRLPYGDGIRFAYCADEDTSQNLRQHNYLTWQDLLQLAASTVD